ncbi:MAG: type II toxin-antitoxin system VapC family toxin [Nostoc sp. DedQUE12b]|uniref:type II toxin-antitoxin system VapC family toxin n=1 Tax=Nostoc sp. DedQUE12b TaxID=3075398 RepID=UPI002AD3615D|nr:type II toxin-antitoxin system VapC family toxin [Nostoc sp. DedQUE12b]MDZ8084892.1 type II toxin-antitoxin system VapC family toxin [Nostoc sp. DedQUE12b]
MIYLDTSVIAPLYWTEALSDAVEELLLNEAEVGLSQLAEVELVSALSRRVRMREISQEDAIAIVERFQSDLDSGFYTQIAVETVHYNLAREWISRFDTPLRTLDALHLTIAFQNNIQLVTADEALATSAEILGVEVLLLR